MNNPGHQMQDKLPVAIDVNFSCQRCCQPLILHTSLNNISKETFNDLIPNSPSSRDASSSEDKSYSDNHPRQSSSSSSADMVSNLPSSSDVIHKTIHSFRKPKLSDCDYSLIIPESSNNQLPSTSITSTLLAGFDQTSDCHSKNGRNLNLQIQLFDILSDQSDIDHPLCQECANFVIEQMDKQLVALEKECEEHAAFKEKIAKTRSKTSDAEVEKLRAKLQKLYAEEKGLIMQLKELNQKQKIVDKKLEDSKNELKQARMEEEKYWQEYNTVKYTYFQCEGELRSLDNKIRNAKNYYKKLKETSVFNMTFCIWYTGQFGTINGFRLGRLPNVQVEWNEINAAWGQCALLLSSLARKLGCSFQRFKIVPYGNFSFIESLDDKTKQLPLYTAGGIKYYFHQKFDQAMVAFLECLQQLYEEIRKQDANFKLPYEMDLKGDIYEKNSNERYSVKININTEEKWTKALKFMLTNLKWAMAWVVTKHGD